MRTTTYLKTAIPCLALALVLMATGCASAPEGDSQPSAEAEAEPAVHPEARANGREARQTGYDFLVLAERSWDSEDAALEYYARALELNCAPAYARFKRGEILIHRDERDAAQEELLRAVEIDPGFAHAHALLGRIALESEDHDVAMEHAEAAVEAAPDLAEPRMLRASIHLARGERERAFEDLRFVADEGNPFERASAYIELGRIALEEGRTEEALEHLAEAVAATPEDTAPYTILAEAYLRSGEAEQALQILETAEEVTWDPLWARTESARILVELGRYEEALERADSVLAQEERIEAVAVRGRAMLGLARYEEAIEALSHYLEVEDWNAAVHADLGHALLRSGRAEEATAHFDVAIEQWWEHPEARAGRAELAEMQGDLDKAAEELGVALEAAPDNACLLIRSAVIAAAQEDEETAKDFLGRVDSIPPHEQRMIERYFTAHGDSVSLMFKYAESLPEEIRYAIIGK